VIMPTVNVVDLSKQKVGTVDLPAELFGCKPHTSLVHEAVVMQRASVRQGTASTLRRGEVSGSGKKPWKQKHTGRARAGSLRSPVWRHGGTVFGPKPRDYSYGMPRKKYRAALQSALSAKLAEGTLLVLADVSLAQAKTKLLAKALDQLGVHGTALLVVGEGRSEIVQAAKNLPSLTVVRPEELNVYDIVRCRSIIIPERELARVKEAWS
jgi:large subunit ribosomal protein L4